MGPLPAAAGGHFCSIMPPPEAGRNGLCNYVWHGMADGRTSRRLTREANNVVIYNQSLSLSLAGSAMRECVHDSVLLWSFLLIPLAFICHVIDFKIPRGFIASNSIASFRNVATYP